MIETDFYILSQEQYDQFNSEASELGLSIDYYLDEFCDIQGEWVLTD
jgi:hypothetical protein